MTFYSATFLVHDNHFAELLVEESIEPSLLFQEGNSTVVKAFETALMVS